MAFLQCRIESGIELVLEHNRFREKLADCSLVITGEGQIDAQTLDGKGPLGVAKLAGAQGVPTIAVVGGLNIDDARLHEAGIQAAFSVVTSRCLWRRRWRMRRIWRGGRLCGWGMCCRYHGRSNIEGRDWTQAEWCFAYHPDASCHRMPVERGGTCDGSS